MSVWDFLYNTEPAKPKTPREKIAWILEEKYSIHNTFPTLKWCKVSRLEDSGGYWEGSGKVSFSLDESRTIYVTSLHATMTECARGFRLIENYSQSCLYGDCLAVPDVWEKESYEIPWERPKVI